MSVADVILNDPMHVTCPYSKKACKHIINQTYSVCKLVSTFECMHLNLTCTTMYKASIEGAAPFIVIEQTYQEEYLTCEPNGDNDYRCVHVWMCVFMHVWMCVCVHVWVWVCVCACVGVCGCMCGCVCVCMCGCGCVFVHVWVWVCVGVCVCMYVYVYVYVCGCVCLCMCGWVFVYVWV